MFLPLPSRVVPIVALGTVALVAWVAGASFKDPATLWAPEHLSRYHADVAHCLDCHQPFRGPATERCVRCHSEKRFAMLDRQEVGDFHRDVLQRGESCLGCHTEHRGALSQITVGAMINPHGEFIFRVTGTRSCSECHAFTGSADAKPRLLDTRPVLELLEEGDGAHRAGRFARCLGCHVGGRLDIDDD